jgi:hypothetical protein
MERSVVSVGEKYARDGGEFGGENVFFRDFLNFLVL